MWYVSPDGSAESVISVGCESVTSYVSVPSPVPVASAVDVPTTAVTPTPGTAAVPAERTPATESAVASVFGLLAYADPVHSVIFVLSAVTEAVYGALEFTVSAPPDVVFAPLEANVQGTAAVGVAVIESVLPS